jgi:putative ABC transport system permease protein
MIALFRTVLALCPPGFRREYGAAMCDDFALALADERTVHGYFGALTYALGAMWDIFTTALREYAAMFFRDFTYALRALRKSPSFTAIVVATLALAIGANAAVFSILRGSVLAPLPYADSDRLVSLDAFARGAPFDFSLPNYANVVRQNRASFASAAAFRHDNATLTGRGPALGLVGVNTTPRLFETLGVRPEIGRFATDADAGKGAAKTVVISDALWHRVFGADPRALGSLVQLEGDAYRLIGVVPPDFHQPRNGNGFAPADYWTVLRDDGTGSEYGSRGYNAFNVVARLQPGASLATASDAAKATARALVRRYPGDDTGFSVKATSLMDSLVGSTRPLLFALFAAVGAVLLVACANVANLLLSRAASREREFSVRIAIGASRGRIVAQLLVETFVLAIAGGAVGILIAFAIVRAFVSLHPANIPRADLITVDAASVLYTFGIVGFCTLAAGLAPAFASSRRDVPAALKSAGRGGDASRGIRARSILVALEIAMTLALVVSAGLVVRSFVALTSQPLGFEMANLSAIGLIDFSDKHFAHDADRVPYMDGLIRAVRAVPGVRDADWGFSLPFTSQRWGSDFGIVGKPVAFGDEPDATLSPIGGGFFSTMHATLQQGRAFDDDDRIGTRPVAIVNATFAKRFFSGRSPLGARIVPGAALDSDATPPARTIVGVVADIRASFLKPTEPTIYLPARQFPFSVMYVVVRMRPGFEPTTVAAAINRYDPLVPAPDVARYDALLARNVATQQLSVAALSSLALVALALSIAGIFAIVSYGVTQRTHEFGVRMALGADGRQIVRTVLGGAMRIAFTGIVLGLIIAGAGTRLLGDQLYDTQPLDPLTFASVTLLVVVAALAAAFVPARRATRVDPIVALRYE